MAGKDNDKKTAQIIKYLEGLPSTYFTQKEFEKKCPIKLQSSVMKQILDEIVCEYEKYLIGVIKCGNLNIYYIYRNFNRLNIKEEIDKSNKKVIDIRESIDANKKKLLLYQKERKAFKEKEKLVKNYHDFSKLHKSLSNQIINLQKIKLENLENLKLVDDKRDRIENLKKLIHQYNDNIELILDHIARKYNIPNTKLHDELNIPMEL
ncbi:hypothetical protein KAFR_0C02990 [Kazachstania africana CBS 2517]|uniref:Mnd1 HTH domain-containing protein n=1 Tax=Kazachstania africana (strain ATCC 22294 / BCRC 22015 / CBS 2517 / CECT 1963 / NBRC 1671 / NRRL Y-8276) TaxID=1071382 RepID=H2ASE2_KAZAF|nr:hypothetical protein KAFR_0C02990 [Kazachstania africana CBS 2517]CCF57292.1 hypothetical protein KAFR_0C02990 [Kazachstania africana CBS 2517]